MKKIMIAMCLAGALCAFSADEKAPNTDAPTKPRRTMGQRGPRPQLTEAQRKERREKFMAEMKARREEAQKKVINVLKEAGLSEEKAKETAEKIEKIRMEGRRFPGMGPGMGPQGGRRGPRPEAK